MNQVSHFVQRHRLHANIIPQDQADLNTQVVMPRQVMKDEEEQYVADRMQCMPALLFGLFVCLFVCLFVRFGWLFGCLFVCLFWCWF
jgi:hypothetical protein